MNDLTDIRLAELADVGTEPLTPAIERFRRLLRDRVAAGARQAGWPLERVPDLTRMAEVPFFFLLGRGAPAAVALLEALFVADKMMAVAQMTRTLRAGFSPQQAFAEIRDMKLRSGTRPKNSDAIAAAASSKFDEALAAGRTPQQALSDAFDAASKVFYGRPAD